MMTLCLPLQLGRSMQMTHPTSRCWTPFSKAMGADREAQSPCGIPPCWSMALTSRETSATAQVLASRIMAVKHSHVKVIFSCTKHCNKWRVVCCSSVSLDLQSEITLVIEHNSLVLNMTYIS